MIIDKLQANDRTQAAILALKARLGDPGVTSVKIYALTLKTAQLCVGQVQLSQGQGSYCLCNRRLSSQNSTLAQ